MVQERTDVPEFMIGRFVFFDGGLGCNFQKKNPAEQKLLKKKDRAREAIGKN